MSDVEALVARDAATFFRQRGSTPCLSALSAASGAWLVDADGRRYLDLHGNTVHHLGHGHPRLVAALKEQLDSLPFCPRRFTNDQAVALAEALLAHWPGPPARVLFATGGSDEGAPGLRPYGAGFYACYLRDPDGNKLSAVCEG